MIKLLSKVHFIYKNSLTIKSLQKCIKSSYPPNRYNTYLVSSVVDTVNLAFSAKFAMDTKFNSSYLSTPNYKRKPTNDLFDNIQKKKEHGTNMVRYFNKVLSLIQSSAFLSDQKNKDVLVLDVMKKTEGHAVKYAFSPKGSKVFEAVITWGSDPEVGKFMEKMEETVCDALSNPFASQVLKTLIEIAAERNKKFFDIKTGSCENTTRTKITNVDVNQNWNPAVSLQTQICEKVGVVTQEELINNRDKKQIKNNINRERTTKYSNGNNGGNDDADDRFSFSEWIVRVSKVVLDDVDLVWNLYANNVMRTVLECLTTLPRDSMKYFNKRPLTDDWLRIPEEHTDLIDCFTQKLLLWQQLTDLVYNDLTSRLLRALLLALKAVDNESADDLVRQLFNECFILKETDLKKKCLSARLCEDEATLLPVFRNEFSASVLQASISVASPELVARIHAGCFTGHLELLSRSRIAGPCLQTLLQYCRGKDDHLMRALHCDFPPGNHRRFIAHVLMLRILGENTREKDFTIHPHGIILLEAMLRFEFPNKVISGMLKLKHHELCQLLSHHPDATIIRTFVENPNIPTNSMTKLFNTLVGRFASLASSEYGSRSLEVMWKAVEARRKVQIMDELTEQRETLQNIPCGKFILKKFAHDYYSANRELSEQVN